MRFNLIACTASERRNEEHTEASSFITRTYSVGVKTMLTIAAKGRDKSSTMVG